MSSTVVRGGLVITATDEVNADVLIDGEQVAALASAESCLGEQWTANAGRVINASGQYVIPGGSTGIPTCKCRSAAPSPRTRLKLARGR